MFCDCAAVSPLRRKTCLCCCGLFRREKCRASCQNWRDRKVASARRTRQRANTTFSRHIPGLRQVLCHAPHLLKAHARQLLKSGEQDFMRLKAIADAIPQHPLIGKQTLTCAPRFLGIRLKCANVRSSNHLHFPWLAAGPVKVSQSNRDARVIFSRASTSCYCCRKIVDIRKRTINKMPSSAGSRQHFINATDSRIGASFVVFGDNICFPRRLGIC